ncbi:MAG TPA: trigger factor [Gammaproteobacteria bacterium]|nr:trigger factor [Gammaproteobacteria bacterium]
MQVSVEAPSKLERRLTVVVPAEKLNEVFDKRISRLAKNAKIDGFRPGKAPLKVIQQRYGDTARQEALSEVIQSSLNDALNQEKLSPVSVPRVEPRMIMPDQPLEYVATFEIMPIIENFHFELKTLEKEIAAITDQDIQRVLDHLRAQHTTWKKIDRAAQEKDQVMIDFLGSIDGVPFAGGQAHDYAIILGSKTMLPGFEEGLLGMKAGEEKTIQIIFPENYFSAAVAGKTADFTLKMLTVKEPELPEMNEVFIKKLGIKSGELSDLQAEIRKNLERELEKVIQSKLKNQVFDKLLEQNTLEIPTALIEREASRIHDEIHPHHEHEHSHTDAEMAQFNEMAKRNVALGLLVAEVIKIHKISADKERIQVYLSKLSSAYENPAEVMDWYAKNKRAYAEIEMQILEEQVVDLLLKDVQITEKMLSYEDLIKA